MLRITTRLAHSRSAIERKPPTDENELSLPANLQQFVLLPAYARIRYKNLLNIHANLEDEAGITGYNMFQENKNARFGVIACGIAYNYLMENFLDKEPFFDVLKIGQYPIPSQLIREMAKKHGELLILEEGYPLIEEQLKGIIKHDVIIKGRLDGSLPRDGELNPYLVANALNIETPAIGEIPEIVKNRPPALCKGCSHVDVFDALNESLHESGAGKVFSDIGCYTLGALPPFNAINSCVDMGASISMAKGAADAGLRPSIAVIGDSTFTHSGMTGLLDAVVENTPVTIIISDNSTTAMTGGQDSAATGRLEKICKGIGVPPMHLKVITPLKKHHGENTRIIKEELAHEGVSVIIARRECIQTARRKKRG
jgi:indolepyruvate ferredoxin oxidoreductase alpha subunit